MILRVETVGCGLCARTGAQMRAIRPLVARRPRRRHRHLRADRLVSQQRVNARQLDALRPLATVAPHRSDSPIDDPQQRNSAQFCASRYCAAFEPASNNLTGPFCRSQSARPNRQYTREQHYEPESEPEPDGETRHQQAHSRKKLSLRARRANRHRAGVRMRAPTRNAP